VGDVVGVEVGTGVAVRGAKDALLQRLLLVSMPNAPPPAATLPTTMIEA
jgi:hypothetical protein